MIEALRDDPTPCIRDTDFNQFNPRDLGYHPPIAADAKIASAKGDEAISSIESTDRKRRTAEQAKTTEGKTAALAVGKCQRSTILT